MKEKYPLLSADDEGVWCQHSPTPATRIGIRWSEILAVSAYKLDCVTEIDTVVTLDFEFGEYLELSSSFPGFEPVLSVIATKIPLQSDWRGRMAALSPEDPPVLLWRIDALGEP